MFDIHHWKDLKTDLGGFNVKWMDSKRKAISSLMCGEYRKIMHFIAFYCLYMDHKIGRAERDCNGIITSNLPTQTGPTENTLHRIASRQSLNLTSEGDSTNSVDNLLQCSYLHTKALLHVQMELPKCEFFFLLPLVL